MKMKLSKGGFVQVSKRDFATLSKHKWFAHKAGNSYYAESKINGFVTKMHRFILGLTDSKIFVDHKDRDGLNNQRSNLRICTRLNNSHNRVCNKNSKSGIKCVHWAKDSNKWHARTRVNGKDFHLGYFDSKEEAAAAYKKASLKLHGKFSIFNNHSKT